VAGGEVPPPPPEAVRGDGGTERAEAGLPEELELGDGVGGGADTERGATEPPRGEEAVGAGGLLSARVWEEEAEERRMRQREEDVSLRWWRARVTAEGARALARVRQEVVRREEEGLRLAEELSEDRLLVALETLELAAERQAAERHVLEGAQDSAHAGRAVGAGGAAAERGVPRVAARLRRFERDGGGGGRARPPAPR
jgi:hypothetical protein